MQPNVCFYDADGNELWSWQCQYRTEPLAYHEAVREHESSWGADAAVNYSKFLFVESPGRYQDVCDAIINLERSGDVAAFCDEYAAIINDMCERASYGFCPFTQRIAMEDIEDGSWRCDMTVHADDDGVMFSD